MWVHCVMDFSSSEWLCWSGDPSEAGALGTDTQHRSFLGTPSSGAPTWVPGRRPGPPLLRSGSAHRGQGLLVSGLAPRIGGRASSSQVWLHASGAGRPRFSPTAVVQAGAPRREGRPPDG